MERLMRGVPWNNEEAGQDPQEPSAPETDTAHVAKIAGQVRSHFKQKVTAAVLNQADLLRNEMAEGEETIAVTVIVRLKKGEILTVTLKQASVPDAAWKQNGRS